MGETEAEQVEAAGPMFRLGPRTDKQQKHEEDDWTFPVHCASVRPSLPQFGGSPFCAVGTLKGDLSPQHPTLLGILTPCQEPGDLRLLVKRALLSSPVGVGTRKRRRK